MEDSRPQGKDTTPSIECDAIGCRELADYRLEGCWLSDDNIRLYVCFVHLPWAAKELRAYQIEGEGPYQITEHALVGNV